VTEQAAVPPEAIQLAAVALHDLECPDRSCEPQVFAHCFRQASAALNAAADLIAGQARAAERERITQLADAWDHEAAARMTDRRTYPLEGTGILGRCAEQLRAAAADGRDTADGGEQHD